MRNKVVELVTASSGSPALCSSDLLLLAVPGDAGLRVVRRPAAVSGGSDDGEGHDRLPQLQHLPHPLEGG